MYQSPKTLLQKNISIKTSQIPAEAMMNMSPAPAALRATHMVRLGFGGTYISTLILNK